MSNLAAIIETVETGLKSVDAACGTYRDDPSGWHQRHRAALGELAAQLTETVGAKVNDRWDGAKVRIAGISSSSTSGLGGALSNWLAAARKKGAV